MCPNTIDLELCPINYFSNYRVLLPVSQMYWLRKTLKKNLENIHFYS